MGSRLSLLPRVAFTSPSVTPLNMQAGSRHNVLLASIAGGAISYPIIPGLECVLDASIPASPILATGALMASLYAYTRTPEFTVKYYRLRYDELDKILRKELVTSSSLITQPVNRVEPFGVRQVGHDLETRLTATRQNVARLDNLLAKHNNARLLVSYPFDAPITTSLQEYSALIARMEGRLFELQQCPEWKSQELAWTMHQQYTKAKLKIQKLKDEKRLLQDEIRWNETLNNTGDKRVQLAKTTIDLALTLVDSRRNRGKK